MEIVTKNYLQKKIARLLFSDKMYDKLRVYKSIMSFKLNLPSDPLFEFLKYFVKEGDLVIDIGANIGQSAIYFSKYVGTKGQVLSVEPVAKNYKSLIYMKKIMRLGNVETLKKAASDEDGEEKILIPVMDKNLIIGTQAVLESSKKTSFENFMTEIVDKTSIDLLSEIYNFSRLRLIKCDTEGGEINVIKGGLKTIEKYKPIIVLEISLKDPQLEILYNLGYASYHYENCKLYPALNSTLEQDPIFIHSSKIEKIKSNLLKHVNV